MKKKPHKPGVNENFLLTRHLKLEGLEREECSKVIAAIDTLVGVDGVSISGESSVLHVAYDGSKRRMEDIEEVLQAHGCSLARDWWTHLKSGSHRENGTNDPKTSARNGRARWGPCPKVVVVRRGHCLARDRLRRASGIDGL